MGPYLCAVDVGTRSARAGIFDRAGAMLARGVAEFSVLEAPGHRAEYRASDIWTAVRAAIGAAIRTAGTAPQTIAALGFDATCSLVLRDRDGAPLALGDGGHDTIAWFDHRAVAEAQDCTATGHALIDHLGGAMSPEMQTPKLLWLKRQRPDLWARLGEARDLADHLTARATGQTLGQAAGSACALATKWPYLPAHGGWQADFLVQIGLGDLRTRAALPDRALPSGACAGRLSPGAAAELGLPAGIPVAAGLIDAYAGALGSCGLDPAPGLPCLTLIAGTSNCIMAMTRTPRFAPGIWGPFRDVLVPGQWVSEGGQSAAGAALEGILDTWPVAGLPARPGHHEVQTRIAALLRAEGHGFGAQIDVLPDFNGNRSPLSDPSARAVISGLALDRGLDGLCALYWRTAVALALGTRQIIAHLNAGSDGARALAIAGGLVRTPLLRQLFADATGLRIVQSQAADAVLLGTAIGAAVAAGLHADLTEAARAMTRLAGVTTPDPEGQAQRQRDYAVMLRMQTHRAELTALRARR